MKIKTIFIGTSEFAVPILNACLNHELLDLKAVITQPDRPVGRKQDMQAPPVKSELQITNYPARISSHSNAGGELQIEQPESIKEVADEILEKYKPELIIVASYGQIIPKSILNYPKYGCLNFHGSLLPKLRGAVPIQMSILNGLEKTGVTLQKMVFKMDEGPIISTREIALTGTETYESLTKTLAELSVEILNEDLRDWIDGTIEAKEQNEQEATYCYIKDTAKDKAEITADTSVEIAERMVRAFYPWPVAWITIKSGKNEGKRLKIFKSRISDLKSEENALTVSMDDNNLVLKLKDGCLIMEEVQLEGKDKRSGEDYLWLVD
ncbi:methionyl-tRNA formyltransferase [Candidatus Dojkabacteria bacterium]|uniref:Methionyl-tRNA formyltransferase n=1 Tax=Candidatus Dojkabacteria bacterium TaxID=2099670 RepID=A0A955L0J8_9BACT|nr:methionyl-tRNA formyltransferase [Candidatus Dojkabacteria bacterium]